MREGESPKVNLDDKFTLDEGKAYMTGVQALVRLPLVIRRHDKVRGLNTAGFISGYRGSPLGNYDMQLQAAEAHLKPEHIFFQPAINEDLGATAVWGSQQVNLFNGAHYDGVFGIWYGKGPGVDRSGDVFKHANFAGTSPLGGVLAIAGDDHSCKSSTLPNQSEYAFWDAEIPTIAPATIEEVLIFGVKAIQMSRYSGCWIGMKTISDLMDAAMSVPVSPLRRVTHIPDLPLSPDGMNIRLSDTPDAKEYRHRHFKLPAAQAFARLNGFDKVVFDSPKARLGVMASGKGYLHVLDAMRLLAIGDDEARSIGLRFLKIGLVWPLDAPTVRAFADGLETLMVVEERRPLMEPQLRSALYSLPDGRRPTIVGKEDAKGAPLLSDVFDLDTVQVALAIWRHLPESARTEARKALVKDLEARTSDKKSLAPIHVRKPFFCSGCPHNSSTQLPEGARATAGIGCHYMATFMPSRHAETCTHMGGEGVTWVGQSPFTSESHIFANLGDGTYFHSGILAIRQAVAAKVNITYKILFNDAVAMTGGQSVDGVLHPVSIAAQVAAEGVKRIAIVSPEPERWRGHAQMPQFVSFHPRDDLDAVQTELQAFKGTSVIIYDQVCATELRRRRKRGLADAPKGRLFINPDVCEGCGDCSVKSNCIAVGPLETELGRKRVIDQSACNTDLSCLKGFCPSFVELEGAKPAAKSGMDVSALLTDLATPDLPALKDGPYNLLLTGIGGFGVTSLSGIIGMAAHIDGLEVMSIDQTGLAQRGGAVDSHIRIATKGGLIPGGRIPLGDVDVLLAADMVTAHGKSGLPLLNAKRTKALINTHLTPTAEFTLNTETRFDDLNMLKRIEKAVKKSVRSDLSRLSVDIFGDSLYVFMIMLGQAWQMGLIPLSEAAINEAIRLNGAAVKQNQTAFAVGRALCLGRIEAAHDEKPAFDLDAFVVRRQKDLSAYQNTAYADTYANLMESAKATTDNAAILETVARNLFKVMAYKDEYEIARLYGLPAFRARISEQFKDTKSVSLWLAPPLLAPKDKHTGLPRKMRFGPWIFTALSLLASLKGLRGTGFDLFGMTEERRHERRLRDDYMALIPRVLSALTPDNAKLAQKILNYPDAIKGFGHIKAANLIKAKAQLDLDCAAYFASPTSSSKDNAQSVADQRVNAHV